MPSVAARNVIRLLGHIYHVISLSVLFFGPVGMVSSIHIYFVLSLLTESMNCWPGVISIECYWKLLRNVSLVPSSMCLSS